MHRIDRAVALLRQAVTGQAGLLGLAEPLAPRGFCRLFSIAIHRALAGETPGRTVAKPSRSTEAGTRPFAAAGAALLRCRNVAAGICADLLCGHLT
ncbi:hypothetical protein [Rhodanobacter sp. KK11]|uniref:hypothetical protein n=1 Tax=Rhodanobacter sp. KK11 TaxID=3083255 RepID=UPI00296724BE|nr:hypothetical protein [Rhodanobacter sp. KK11]MDW2981066.1 hypothetical protein [Rhodanobacter sp. KK11]